MKKTVLTYGLISGGVSALLMLGMGLYLRNVTDSFDNSHLYGYTGIILSMLFVYIGVRAYRDQVAGGAISFGKAFQVGLYICLISCAFYAITWLIVYNTLLPDFMDRYMEATLQKMRESGASAEKISKETAEMEKFGEMYKNPFINVVLTFFVEPFPVGLLIVLISATILSRR